jgi:hypothetical protein
VVADLEPIRRAPLDAIPDRFWFHDRGALASFMWDEEAPRANWPRGLVVVLT